MPWQLLANSAKVLAVHAAYMGFGKIVYFGGDEHDPEHNERNIINATCLFDCGTNAVTRIASPRFDTFCCGHAFLGASNIVKLLVAGGTEQFDQHAEGPHLIHFPGLRDAAIFSSPDFITPSAGGWTWSRAERMTPGPLASSQPGFVPDPERTGGRWYPTLVTLPNGQVIAFSGHPGSSDAAHNNDIPEVFSRQPEPRGRWTRLADYANPGQRDHYERRSMTLYPRLHVLPTGDILCTNPIGEETFTFQPNVGPNGGAFHTVNVFPAEHVDEFRFFDCTSVLLPLRHDDPAGAWTARALICGGMSEVAYTLDLKGWTPGGAQRPWQKTSRRPLRQRRVHANAVILPTGEILVCGGINVPDIPNAPTRDADAVGMPEIYNPYDGRWEKGDAAATSPRNYHSVALLMPDGRVWTAGSDKDAGRGAGPPPPGNPDVRNLDIEIYSPWYVGEPGRPFINAAPSLAYPGETVLVRSTFADEIIRVVLVRCGSCTHAFNSDQRMVEVAFSHTGGDALQVTMPPNSNIFVPGPYLIFTLRRPRNATDAKVQALGLPSTGTDIYIVPERRREPERPNG